jgi:CheY-like chemotaxis protein
MLVCDDAERLALLKPILDYEGALVTTCASPDAVRRVLERLRVNVLVAALGTTSEDRARVITTLRALPRERGGAVPAIALTGSVADEEKLLAAGFQRCVLTPVHAAELCLAIAMHAAESHA